MSVFLFHNKDLNQNLTRLKHFILYISTMKLNCFQDKRLAHKAKHVLVL